VRGFVRTLVHARHERRALRRGTAAIAAAQGQAIVLARAADGERALVAVNSGREPARVEIDPVLAAGLSALAIPEVAPGRIVDGRAIELPPQGALVLA
jgi:hypothetical protein